MSARRGFIVPGRLARTPAHLRKDQESRCSKRPTFGANDPCGFVYLGRAYCCDPRSRALIPMPRVVNSIKLGLTVVDVFALAFGPFVYFWDQLEPLRQRLFPFARGLCHAYWAPNAWALYTFADKVLARVGFFSARAAAAAAAATDTPITSSSGTRGLIGDTSFTVLPAIAPAHTFLLTLLFQLLPLVKLWFSPTWETFLGSTTLCAYAAFLFGWHVHEKAVLHILLPMSLLALRDRRYLAAFHPLAVAGHLGLFPLLLGAQEAPLKFLYTLCWLVVFLLAFGRLAAPPLKRRIFFLDRVNLLYDAAALALAFYVCFLHDAVVARVGGAAAKYEFLPLMAVSVFSAVGVVGSWIGFMVVYFQG
ncbi:glycosyl transferase [Ascosphaera acerosa]|nr:glycosyl transferase [Ascosphaera acerosa]